MRPGRNALLVSAGLALVVFIAGAANRQPTPSAPTSFRTPSSAAPVATSQVVTPTPTLDPTPTPDPASALVFGKLTYDADACWARFRDSQGHIVGGVKVRFQLPVTNPTKAKMPGLHIVVAETGGADILLVTTGWKKPEWGMDRFGGMVLTLPALAPGKTTLKWAVAFLTPFDPHYRVTVTRDPTALVMPELAAWSLWTSVSIC